MSDSFKFQMCLLSSVANLCFGFLNKLMWFELVVSSIVFLQNTKHIENKMRTEDGDDNVDYLFLVSLSIFYFHRDICV